MSILNEKQLKIRDALLQYAFISLEEYGGQRKIKIPYIVFVVSGIYKNSYEARHDLPLQINGIKKSLFSTNGKKILKIIKDIDFDDFYVILTVDSFAIAMYGYFEDHRLKYMLGDFEANLKQMIIHYAIQWFDENSDSEVEIPYGLFITLDYFEDLDDVMYNLPLYMAEITSLEDGEKLFQNVNFGEHSMTFTVDQEIIEQLKEN